MMLDRIFGQELLMRSLNARLERRAYKIVEYECAVHKQCETEDLQPFECLPAQTQRDDPDEERTAGIDGRARRSGDGASYGETEEVETTRCMLVLP